MLPCLDEEQALPAVLKRLPEGWPVLVVDNGSTDATAEVARAHGARVVVEPRRGYGAAVHTGLVNAEADVVAFLDGDGSLDPDVLPAMAETVTEGRADMAVGRRIPDSAGVWPWHARAANAVIAAMLRGKGVPVHDIAPIRVAHRKALIDLQIEDRAFGYPLELLIKAGAAGWTLDEVPVTYSRRAGGRSKVSGSVKGTVRAARDMTGLLR